MNILIFLLFVVMAMIAVGITLLGYIINLQTEMITTIDNVTHSTNRLVSTIDHGVASPQAAAEYHHQTEMLEQLLNRTN
jgi:predicted PurR-regulated permease PerM